MSKYAACVWVPALDLLTWSWTQTILSLAAPSLSFVNSGLPKTSIFVTFICPINPWQKHLLVNWDTVYPRGTRKISVAKFRPPGEQTLPVRAYSLLTQKPSPILISDNLNFNYKGCFVFPFHYIPPSSSQIKIKRSIYVTVRYVNAPSWPFHQLNPIATINDQNALELIGKNGWKRMMYG